MAGVRHDRDLIAWQMASSFKTEVLALIRASAAAGRDWRYRDQLMNASTAVTKDIAEGFLRYSPPTFATFLDYALGSLGEAEDRLEDGMLLGYFSREQCEPALKFGRRAAVAIVRLKQSQRRYSRRPAPSPNRDDRPEPSRPKGKDDDLNAGSSYLTYLAYPSYLTYVAV